MGKENDAGQDVQQPMSLTARLEAEAAKALADESAVPAPSSMAERFAPEPSAGAGGGKGAQALSQFRAPAAGRFAASEAQRAPLMSQAFFVTMGAVALLPSLVLAALYGHDVIGLPAWVPMPPALSSAKPASPMPPPSPPRAAIASVAPPETILPKRAVEPPTVALTLARAVSGEAGKDVTFPIDLDANGRLPFRSIISVRGLPEGAVFSAGRPYGETEWSFRPDEIGDLSLTLPPDASGAHDVSAELVTGDGMTLASGTTRLDVAADPRAALIIRPGDQARIDELLEHGRKMIHVGYLAGARGYFKRAAEAGSAEAALAVGETYDPGFIAAIGAQGIPADIAEARAWYERAELLGSPAAADRLSELEEAAAKPQSGLVVGEGDVPAEQGSAPEQQAALPAASLSEMPDSEWVEISSAVNVRAEPTPEGETLKIAQAGTRYKATARKGRWVQVTDPKTSEVGWVYSRFLAAASAP